MISHVTVVEATIRNDISVLCVNNKIKQCYSIIVEFMMNYEKQVLITDIKMNQQCFICQVSSHERKNLNKTVMIVSLTTQDINRDQYSNKLITKLKIWK